MTIPAHRDSDLPPLTCDVVETIAIGPTSVFFSNQNQEMGLRGHSHHATVTAVYETLITASGGHGFPSFLATNDALRARIRDLTSRPFRDATNEDVARRLFAWLDDWAAPEWAAWGGAYRLHSVELAVMGTPDRIGHDDGTSVYRITRAATQGQVPA